MSQKLLLLLLVAGHFAGHFWSVKLAICPLWVRILRKFGGWIAVYGRKIGEKLAICPLFAHFYFKSGQAETLAPQGFAGFLAICPLFFLIKCEKKY